MRAMEGAVDRVKMEDGELHCHVIGEATAKGICGSGIVDLLAELFLHGWIDIRGILQPEKSRWIVEKDGMLAVNYAPELYFYQSDIEEFIRTKAAAYTMVAIMLRESGIELSELEGFYVAALLENTCPKNPRSLSACIRTWNGIGSSMRAILPWKVRYVHCWIAVWQKKWRRSWRKWCISSSQR